MGLSNDEKEAIALVVKIERDTERDEINTNNSDGSNQSAGTIQGALMYSLANNVTTDASIEIEAQENTSDDDYRPMDRKNKQIFDQRQKKSRSSNFTPDETALLINCVRSEKSHVFSKDVTKKGSMKKRRAWIKIKNMFNQRVSRKRSLQCLRTKCENMRRHANKLKASKLGSALSFDKLDFNDRLALSFNRLDDESTMSFDNFDDSYELPVSFEKIEKDMQEVDSHAHNPDDSKQPDADNQGKVLFSLLNDNDPISATEMDEQENSQSDEDHGDLLPRHRSSNFSPEETSILVSCVRAEKKYLFNKDTTKKGSLKKKRAWDRVKQAFNSKSPRKRSVECLRTKLTNLRNKVKMLKGSAQKHEALDSIEVQESSHPVKSEPLSFEYRIDARAMSDDNGDQETFSDEHDTNDRCLSPDPLSTVLNSDSGIGHYFAGSSITEDRDVVKMQLELLKYQMETAKMERKRVEDAVKADAASKEAKALETSLRLRAARLQALAAEHMHAPEHPALHYTTEELAARNYLKRYR